MSYKIAVLDIESKRIVEDWDRPWEGGLSVACAWISWRGGDFGQPLFFREDRLTELYDLLHCADVIVTWNGKRYDLKVISHLIGYRGSWPNHCDLKLLVCESAGERLSLDPVARATLGRGKSGKATAAPQLYREGKHDQLYTYNYDDVALLRDLYLYAQKHGFLWVPYGRTKRAIPVGVDVGMEETKTGN